MTGHEQESEKVLLKVLRLQKTGRRMCMYSLVAVLVVWMVCLLMHQPAWMLASLPLIAFALGADWYCKHKANAMAKDYAATLAARKGA